MSYTRFAIFYVPTAGDLAGFGARWLGWDIITARSVAQFDIPDLAKVTSAPRKYGFHGTLKPPFRLSQGFDLDDLQSAIAALAATLAPATCDGLQLSRLGNFLAFTPTGDTAPLAQIAASCVTMLDHLRAPATQQEQQRRRQAGLSPAQETNLTRWGYPYVMDEFRFHLTLTGPLPQNDIAQWKTAARRLAPVLPAPFVIDSIALVGERMDGQCEVIGHAPLTG